jgi:nicotinate-nucleotide adenylyltransferase
MAKARVGLLTGTFDPVHLGHVALARAAQAAAGLSEVWFLVNPSPGHKRGVTDVEARVAMVRLAVEGEVGLREGESDSDGPVGHNLTGFEQLMGRYPEREFVFIVGADVLPALDSWEEADRARELEYVAARRAGDVELNLDEGLRVTWVDLTEHAEASSRKVQAELQAGKRPDSLNPKVYEYIRERGLYA